MNQDEWLVCLDHPRITPELRASLQTIFQRLAYLNKLDVGGMDRRKLTENEEYERQAWSQLHSDVRYGRGPWSAFIDLERLTEKHWCNTCQKLHRLPTNHGRCRWVCEKCKLSKEDCDC